MDRPISTIGDFRERGPLLNLPFTRTPQERAVEGLERKRKQEEAIKEKAGQVIDAVRGTGASRLAGSVGGGIFISAPSVFHLKYKKGNGEHPFLNRFLPTVLSDMKVNYTAAGSHSTFYDGTPTNIQVDMQFKELNPIFREDYDSAGGVGY